MTKKVLFICVHNSARSQMAAAWLNDICGDYFEAESAGRFDVRQAILGQLQEGGDPSPFDRIQATRLAANCVDFLCAEAGNSAPGAAFIGLCGGDVQFTNLADLPLRVRPRIARVGLERLNRDPL